MWLRLSISKFGLSKNGQFSAQTPTHLNCRGNAIEIQTISIDPKLSSKLEDFLPVVNPNNDDCKLVVHCVLYLIQSKNMNVFEMHA